LPVHQIAPAVQAVIEGGEDADVEVNAMDRRGRPVRCRVRITPLLYNDRDSHGAVLVVEENRGEQPTN
jgi:two-component system CheB/CheR fusion protein